MTNDCSMNHPYKYTVIYVKGRLHDLEVFKGLRSGYILQVDEDKKQPEISRVEYIANEHRMCLKCLMKQKKLTRTFTTDKGNYIELTGCEKINNEYRYSIKVNGKHIQETFTEETLIKMIKL
jgi:hypothetical protein